VRRPARGISRPKSSIYSSSSLSIPAGFIPDPQLLDAVWGYGHDGYEHTVNSHINRLRAKIEKDSANPHFILTVWGVGYKFCEIGSISALQG
jgi:hypothetical protein